MSKYDLAGLYDPSFERDSCGFGLIANLDDKASHWVLETAVSALARLTHRGAVAADGKTGDGCGLLIKFPESFLRDVGTELGMQLNERFAAGTVFLSQDEKLANQVRSEIDEGIRSCELEVAGWRKVPVHPDACGELALQTLPRIEQVFVNAPSGMPRGTFNRTLFLARTRDSRLPSAYFISVFPRTHCPSGVLRNRFAFSRTMVRSTRFRATETGHWQGLIIFARRNCRLLPTWTRSFR
jgi:glutamate synthase (NADPH/NADH) large chain